MRLLLQGVPYDTIRKDDSFRGYIEDIKYILIKNEMLKLELGEYVLTRKGKYVANHGGIIRIYYKERLMIYLQILGAISAIIGAIIAVYNLL